MSKQTFLQITALILIAAAALTAANVVSCKITHHKSKVTVSR